MDTNPQAADGRFHAVVPADRSRLAALAAEADAFVRRLGPSERAAFVAGLVLEEVTANIVDHGGDRPANVIEIRLEPGHGHLVLVVEDDGGPFDPLRSPLPDLDAPLSERRVGGLGIHLVRTMCRDLEYRREGGRNVLLARIDSPAGQGGTT
jgi:anti-sigma regulatory factor (Ser/Thr protein kinase)